MSLYEKIYNLPDTDTVKADRIAALPSLTPVQLDCLVQLISPVWDGNLMSKQTRSELVQLGLVSRCEGLNFCTQDGYTFLAVMGHLEDNDGFKGGKPWKTYAKGR